MPTPPAIAKFIAVGASILLLSGCAMFEPRPCTCPQVPGAAATVPPSASESVAESSAPATPAAVAPMAPKPKPAQTAKMAAAAPAPVESGEPGRIYFYRASIFGTVLQPDIMLNGETVGKAVPKEYTYVDRPPGNYQVTTTLKNTRSLTFTLGPAQTAYVEVNVVPGIIGGKAIPLLVEEGEAKEELKHRHMSGR